jgi:hypothetical protein
LEDILTKWPAHADPLTANPRKIEVFLEDLIVQAQVTLLGEIDLDAPSNYHDCGFTIWELANFVFSKPVITNGLTNRISGPWRYPAVVAIWSVSQAQRLEDGTELWTTADLDARKRIVLAKTFSESIDLLHLENFDEKLLGMQHHIMLARFHAIIPTYAIENYASLIRRGTEFHYPPALVFSDITHSQVLSKAVTKLFEAKHELALDLISRSIDTIRYAADAGLPPRLTGALIDRRGYARPLLNKDSNHLPIVSLDETNGELYIKGKDNWICTDGSGNQIDTDSLPNLEIFIGKSGRRLLTILDPSDGYLLFNSEFDLIENKSIPATGCWIIWSPEVKFDEAILVTEALPIYSWPTWKMGYLNAQTRIQIELASGLIRTLGQRRSLELIESRIEYLTTRDGLPIFSKVPIISDGQVATALDVISGENLRLGPDDAPISRKTDGILNISLYAGLGRTKKIHGLLIPNFELLGDLSPLIKDEQRTIKISLPSQWSGPSQLTAFASNNSSKKFELFTGPDGTQYELALELRLLTWSIEFNAQDPEVMNSLGSFPVKTLGEVRRLVIHNAGDPAPMLHVLDKGKEIILTPRQRKHDALYDLETIRGAAASKEIRLKVYIRGREIPLISFISRDEKQPKNRMKSVNLQDLVSAALEKGIFSQEDWNAYDVQRKQTSMNLRYDLRRTRERTR